MTVGPRCFWLGGELPSFMYQQHNRRRGARDRVLRDVPCNLSSLMPTTMGLAQTIAHGSDENQRLLEEAVEIRS